MIRQDLRIGTLAGTMRDIANHGVAGAGQQVQVSDLSWTRKIRCNPISRQKSCPTL
jgi:hypothetical protein